MKDARENDRLERIFGFDVIDCRWERLDIDETLTRELVRRRTIDLLSQISFCFSEFNCCERFCLTC
jgi:hypothetical protein